jgi:hypothetical protein
LYDRSYTLGLLQAKGKGTQDTAAIATEGYCFTDRHL